MGAFLLLSALFPLIISLAAIASADGDPIGPDASIIILPLLLWALNAVRLLIGGAWVGARTQGDVLFNLGGGVLLVDKGYLLIVVVTLEESLDTVPSEQYWVLSHLFSVIIFPLAIGIFGIKVVLFGWYERRFILHAV